MAGISTLMVVMYSANSLHVKLPITDISLSTLKRILLSAQLLNLLIYSGCTCVSTIKIGVNWCPMDSWGKTSQLRA
jgi:hypothetical protein